MLYIVPTPIGNLGDFTFRAVETLKQVSYVLAEDTRTSGKLLRHYDIPTQLIAFHAHNEHKVLDKWVEALQAGTDIALISDAGTPGISDPGFLLVRACVEKGIPLTCLPGPTAFVPALVSTGFPINYFHFEGFLPHKKGRKTRWDFLTNYPYSIILYESPHRIGRTIREAAGLFGDRKVAICRELSKKFETIHRDTLTGMHEQIENGLSLKGEMVVIIA